MNFYKLHAFYIELEADMGKQSSYHHYSNTLQVENRVTLFHHPRWFGGELPYSQYAKRVVDVI
jgi:hypothetical protein